jgi:glycosyltransferase involved in cell wall biosynthesis
MSSDAARTFVNPPVVSVIIPCFNLGAFVAEAVESVLKQTFRDYDVVLVDDGSTDPDTTARLDALAETPGVALVRSANRGLSAARNTGIKHSTGRYICALDADDRIRPEWLERSVAILESHPQFAFVSHWVQAFGDRTFEWTPGRADLPALLDHNVFNGAALFRRTIVDTVGGFDESMRDGCEDWEFWLRVLEQGFEGTIIPELLYEYRQRDDSMSRAMHDTGAFERIYAGMVDAHRPSFETHLLDLILRRDWAFADVCRRLDNLDIEISTLLEPAVAERRQELAVATQRLTELETAAALRETNEKLADETRALTAERDRAVELFGRVEHERRQADEARRQAERAWADARDAQAAVQASLDGLLRSLSWRLTAPLRRVYEALRLGPRSGDDR